MTLDELDACSKAPMRRVTGRACHGGKDYLVLECGHLREIKPTMSISMTRKRPCRECAEAGTTGDVPELTAEERASGRKTQIGHHGAQHGRTGFCQYPGCTTKLNSYNKTRYCWHHSGKGTEFV
jgi:hypothetical protein